jgi:flagellin
MCCIASSARLRLPMKQPAIFATGNKVQSALDSPYAFFQARNLSNRAGDPLAVKDRIGKSLQTVQAASVRLQSLGRTVDQLHSFAAGARGGSAAKRQLTAQLFNKVTNNLITSLRIAATRVST